MSHNLGNEILASKEFRHYWSEMYLRQNIPFQIKTMRTQRGLNQTDAAAILGKVQNGVSRLESLSYGRVTLQSLLEVAEGYDVGLIVKFVPFSRLLREYHDVSFDTLAVASPDREKFPDEVAAIEEWGSENTDEGIREIGAESQDATAKVLSSDRFAKERVSNPDSRAYSLPLITEVPSIAKSRDTDTKVTRTSDVRDGEKFTFAGEVAAA